MPAPGVVWGGARVLEQVPPSQEHRCPLSPSWLHTSPAAQGAEVRHGCDHTHLRKIFIK